MTKTWWDCKCQSFSSETSPSAQGEGNRLGGASETYKECLFKCSGRQMWCVCLGVCLCVCLSLCICLCVTLCLDVWQSAGQSVCQSVCLSACLTWQRVFLPVCESQHTHISFVDTQSSNQITYFRLISGCKGLYSTVPLLISRAYTSTLQNGFHLYSIQRLTSPLSRMDSISTLMLELIPLLREPLTDSYSWEGMFVHPWRNLCLMFACLSPSCL